MKKLGYYKSLTLGLVCLLIPFLIDAQFTTQAYAANYGGGSSSGGSFSMEVNTNAIGGISSNDKNEIFLGLAAFNLKSGVISVNANLNGSTLNDEVTGTLLRIEESGNYDTLDLLENQPSSFSFNPVFEGDYLVNVDSDPEKFVATYFGDVFLWEEAEILTLTGDSTIAIAMVEVPGEDPTATGVVSGTIEEDFGEEEEERITARRRAKRRKCGLRRRRTGGRTGQDNGEFELIAYGETNDNGEFEYGFLPEGTYRFFVEYPGIPLDETSFVQFDIGESGVSDDTFVLAVFATEEGVTIELILGVTSQFFTDFKVYPNPTQDFINISYDKILSRSLTLEVLNLEGKSYLRNHLSNSENKEIQIDVRSLTAGTYLIRFIDTEKPTNELVFRFIKR